MPANLPPEYFVAEKKFRQAKTVSEKIAALEEMLSIMPHHKGTDKLRALLRRKLAKLKEESLVEKGKKGKKDIYAVKKESTGQVAMAGLPNSGKSQLLSALTNANPTIADYPFSTQKPQTGMIPYENIKIQLVDLPPVTPHTDGWVYGIMKNADLLLLVIDISGDPIGDFENLKELLLERKISPVSELPEEVSDDLIHKKSILVFNKGDLVDEEDFSVLKELLETDLPMTYVSAKEKMGCDVLKKLIFSKLDIIRVYPKPPGKKPDMEEPVVLPKGSTVIDLAEEIHKDFAKKLKYARVWGSGRFEGQRVTRDYVLEDGDIVELHV